MRPRNAVVKEESQKKTVGTDLKLRKQNTINVSNIESRGIYVTGILNGIHVDCLVDTGATLDIFSTKIWDKINVSQSLDRFEKDIVTASGEPIEIAGKTKISFGIENTEYDCDVLVERIEADVILGLEFLKKENASLDFVNNLLILGNKSYELNNSFHTGCYRVVVAEKTEILCRTEMIIKGKVSSNEFMKENDCLVEPTEKLIQAGTTVLAKTLVSGNAEIPLRLMNLSDETQTLYPGRHIASTCPVTKITDVKLDQVQFSQTSNIPGHLQDLYNSTISGLDHNQTKAVAKLLSKYSDVFSKHDYDIGRTGIIKHKISTGNSQPIKQPLRRVPLHMNTEVDNQIKEMLNRDVLQVSTSPWASGVIMVKKKDGT